MRSFPEFDRAEWFPLAVARHKLVPGQVPILQALTDVLRMSRGGRGKPAANSPSPAGEGE